eukprot:SAG22_NODE_1171_length_5254_cov_61.602716_1_plen_581_part_00
MLAGVTHASAQASYADLQKSIQSWGDGDDAMDRLGALLAGPSKEEDGAGEEEKGLRFAGKLAGKLRRKAAERPDDAASSGSGTRKSSNASEAKGGKSKQKKEPVGLFDESMADYQGRMAETMAWATENGLAGDEELDGLPPKAKVLASIQGIDHWWMEQRKAMVLGPAGEGEGGSAGDEKDAMLARLVAGVPRRARPSSAEKELQKLEAKEKREAEAAAAKTSKKTVAERAADAKQRREAQVALDRVSTSVFEEDKLWRKNGKRPKSRQRKPAAGRRGRGKQPPPPQQQTSIYDNSLEVMPGGPEVDGYDSEEDEAARILETLSPRTDHPAWLLVPKRAVAVTGKPLPPGITAPKKAAKSQQPKQRSLDQLASGYWDERHTALSMQLKAPPSREGDGGGGGGGGGSGKHGRGRAGEAAQGAAVTGRYRRLARAQAANAKAAPGLAALLNSTAELPPEKPGAAYKAGRRSRTERLPANLPIRKSPTKSQQRFRSGHTLSPTQRRTAAPADDRGGGVGGGAAALSPERLRHGRRSLNGSTEEPEQHHHRQQEVTSPPRVRAAVTMAEHRSRKSGSKYLLIDV